MIYFQLHNEADLVFFRNYYTFLPYSTYEKRLIKFYEVRNGCKRSCGHFHRYVYSKMNSHDLFIRVRSQILLVRVIVLWGAAGLVPGS